MNQTGHYTGNQTVSILQLSHYSEIECQKLQWKKARKLICSIYSQLHWSQKLEITKVTLSAIPASQRRSLCGELENKWFDWINMKLCTWSETIRSSRGFASFWVLGEVYSEYFWGNLEGNSCHRYMFVKK